MTLNDITGLSGWASPRAPAHGQQATREAPVDAARPAAPTFSGKAVVQTRRSEATDPKDTQRSLMLQAQSLAVARQEEMRLQQKLSQLRETIVETENRLREMQADEVDPIRH